MSIAADEDRTLTLLGRFAQFGSTAVDVKDDDRFEVAVVMDLLDVLTEAWSGDVRDGDLDQARSAAVYALMILLSQVPTATAGGVKEITGALRVTAAVLGACCPELDPAAEAAVESEITAAFEQTGIVR